MSEVASSKMMLKTFEVVKKNQSAILSTLGGVAKGSVLGIGLAASLAPFTMGTSLFLIPGAIMAGVVIEGPKGFIKGKKKDDRRNEEKKEKLLEDFKKMIEKVEIPDCDATICLLNETSEEKRLRKELEDYKTELENDLEDVNSGEKTKPLLEKYKEIMENEVENCREIIEHEESDQEKKTEF